MSWCGSGSSDGRWLRLHPGLLAEPLYEWAAVNLLGCGQTVGVGCFVAFMSGLGRRWRWGMVDYFGRRLVGCGLAGRLFAQVYYAVGSLLVQGCGRPGRPGDVEIFRLVWLRFVIPPATARAIIGCADTLWLGWFLTVMTVHAGSFTLIVLMLHQ